MRTCLSAPSRRRRPWNNPARARSPSDRRPARASAERAARVGRRRVERAYRNDCCGDRTIRHRVEDAADDLPVVLHADDPGEGAHASPSANSTIIPSTR